MKPLTLQIVADNPVSLANDSYFSRHTNISYSNLRRNDGSSSNNKSSAPGSAIASSSITTKNSEIHLGNMDRINAMSPEQLEESRQEAESMVPANLKNFLRNRRNKVNTTNSTATLPLQPAEPPEPPTTGDENAYEHNPSTINDLQSALKTIHPEGSKGRLGVEWMLDNDDDDNNSKNKNSDQIRIGLDGEPIIQATADYDPKNHHHSRGPAPSEAGYTLNDLSHLLRSKNLPQQIIAAKALSSFLTATTTTIKQIDSIKKNAPLLPTVLRCCLDVNHSPQQTSVLHLHALISLEQLTSTICDENSGTGRRSKKNDKDTSIEVKGGENGVRSERSNQSEVKRRDER